MERNVTRDIIDACSNVVNLGDNVIPISAVGRKVYWTSDRAEASGLSIIEAKLNMGLEFTPRIKVQRAIVSAEADGSIFSVLADRSWETDLLRECPYAQVVLDSFRDYFNAFEDPRNNPYSEAYDTLSSSSSY